jgi:hypothetical protein
MDQPTPTASERCWRADTAPAPLATLPAYLHHPASPGSARFAFTLVPSRPSAQFVETALHRCAFVGGTSRCGAGQRCSAAGTACRARAGGGRRALTSTRSRHSWSSSWQRWCAASGLIFCLGLLALLRLASHSLTGAVSSPSCIGHLVGDRDLRASCPIGLRWPPGKFYRARVGPPAEMRAGQCGELARTVTLKVALVVGGSVVSPAKRHW